MSDIEGDAELDADLDDELDALDEGVEDGVADDLDADLDDGAEDDTDELDADNEVLAPTATEVLRYLVKSLVDDPEAVHVDAIERRRGVLLEVRVAQGELGRVIGRKGRTAQSLRTVARAAATRDDVTVDVDFVD